MKQLLYILCATMCVLFGTKGISQTYNISSGGTINTCSGNFYDSGGSGSGYGNNQNYTMTFCSSTAGQVIQVNFSSFFTEKNYDYLYVYDGSSTASPLMGSISGNNGAFNITSTSGCLTFKFTSDGNSSGSGWSASISCVNPIYNINSGGTKTTCNATFYDSGGSGSNYGNNQSYTMTICPSTAGQCISAAFSSFNTEANYDFLSIYDANTTAPLRYLGQYSGNTNIGTLTASTANASGCLTFVFTSDANTNASGWAANISCGTCVAPSPPPNNDCYVGRTICSNSSFAGNAYGPGVVTDITGSNYGCLGDYGDGDQYEHQSSWYYFSSVSNGTIGLTITPASTSTDYDWAIWGPVSSITCPPSGTPIRCSSADGNGTSANITGMGNGSSQTDEGSNGDGWVKTLPVLAGQKFIFLLDNWNATSAAYSISWQLSGGASMNCGILPIELAEFTGEKQSNSVLLKWTTLSEINNDYFSIERSSDGANFEEIKQVKGAGNSTAIIKYQTLDNTPQIGINYYRIKQVDNNGIYKYSDVVPVEFVESQVLLNNLHPNPTSNNIDFDFYSPVKGTLHLQIIDCIGHVLLDDYKNIQEGKSVINTKMEELSLGIYSLKVSFDATGYSSVSKIIKQ